MMRAAAAPAVVGVVVVLAALVVNSGSKPEAASSGQPAPAPAQQQPPPASPPTPAPAPPPPPPPTDNVTPAVASARAQWDKVLRFGRGGNCSGAAWRASLDMPWTRPAYTKPPVWVSGESTGCLSSRVRNASHGAQIEVLNTSVAKGEEGSHCWALTRSAPCLHCCGTGTCLKKGGFYGSAHRQKLPMVGFRAMIPGIPAHIDPDGGMSVGNINALAVVNAWGLRSGYCLPPKKDPGRLILIMPVKFTASWSYRANLGHWLSGIFVPFLVHSWNYKGPVVPLVIHSCAYGRAPGFCGYGTATDAIVDGLERLGGAAAASGMPWVSTIMQQHGVPTDYSGYWNLQVACESCSAQEWLPRYMPIVRDWLAITFPRYSLLHHERAGAAAPGRKLLLLNRRPYGSRWIENVDPLVERANALGWSAQTLRVDKKCGYADTLPQAMYDADVVVGFNGADLGTSAVMQRTGTVLVEFIDDSYAYLDGWEIFQGLLGSRLKVLRVILPHDSIEYFSESSPNLHESAKMVFNVVRSYLPHSCLPEHNQTYMFKVQGCWRFVPCTVRIPPGLWEQVLGAAAALRDSRAEESELSLSPIVPWDLYAPLASKIQQKAMMRKGKRR
eukprot:TRINITY_DN757_c1_g2_i2.p1 TRINITY_DN757_c1_g2~~TRINITY_DN757_c1_g2_i2.p1  ORF type:complete len:613 (+),score=178.34 TRINITY_DN757_c1_g2_i2:44-1882(+)